MTAAAEAVRGDDGVARPRPGRPARARCAPVAALLCAAAVLSALMTACTGSAPAPDGAVEQPGMAATATPPTVPAADERAIRATVDRINAAAAGPVADQQKVLADVVDPGSAAELVHCPPTTATVRLEPVYPGLRGTPDWRPRTGSLSGTLYALPVLIRIYTGDRITGTDLTTLHLGVLKHEASLTALCVS